MKTLRTLTLGAALAGLNLASTFLPGGMAYAQTTNLVATYDLSVLQSHSEFTTPALSPQTSYFFLVSGRWGTGPLDRGEAMADAGWSSYRGTDGIWGPLDVNRYATPPFTINGQPAPRPTPDQYRQDHVYVFELMANGSSLTVAFDDFPTGDNVGGPIHVELYQVTQQDPAFVWTKLPGSTNLPTGWQSLPGSMDEARRIVYSLTDNGVFWKYDIGSNSFTQLQVTGWPGRADTFIYNPVEDTVWLTLNGRGQVFRLPVTGGAVTSVGASGASSADFGSISFWNPVTQRFGTFNGYGFMAVRNWRWEFGTTDNDWVQIEPNTPGRQPWPRSGGLWAVDNIGQRIFHAGGSGNSSGQQGQVEPGFESLCGDTRFDALRDLWILDLKSNTWVNLIPLNTAIRQFGPLVYFPPQDMLLMINGHITTSCADRTGVWTFAIGKDTNYTEATISGDIPSASDDAASYPYYDSVSKSVIYFNNSGVYALSAPEAPQPCIPHRASATAQVVNGFIVGITMTDPGCGYTNTSPPAVIFRDSTGTGGTATAIVNNDGVVQQIQIDTNGHDYTDSVRVLIAPPPFLPTLTIGVSRVNVTVSVVLGRRYQLESSANLATWSPVGDPFVAQDDTVTQEFVVQDTGRYFRINEVP